MVRYFSVIFILFFLDIHACCQLNPQTSSDSIHRRKGIIPTIGIGVVWSGSIIGLSSVWYNEYPKSSFHTFDDSQEWMQMDKMGHVFSAYHLSDKVSKLYGLSGLTRKKSAWLGAGIGWGYQLSFEFLDGMNAGWGFSWSDVGANTLGSGLFLSQELLSLIHI
jgi:hypothetical protein